MKAFLVIVAVVVAALVGAWVYTHRHTATATGTVATAAGAAYCDDTGYKLRNRLDGSQTPIYSCGLPAGVRCVTYTDGLARDVTAEVKLLWAGTLGSETGPACLP